MSAWPARLDGDVWRCGRQEDGRYCCEGIVANTTILASGQRVTAYPLGYREGPPGWYLPSARSRKARRLVKPRRPNLKDSPVGPPRWAALALLIETRTRCLEPHCGAVAGRAANGVT